jgi:hypothetical protein
VLAAQVWRAVPGIVQPCVLGDAFLGEQGLPLLPVVRANRLALRPPPDQILVLPGFSRGAPFGVLVGEVLLQRPGQLGRGSGRRACACPPAVRTSSRSAVAGRRRPGRCSRWRRTAGTSRRGRCTPAGTAGCRCACAWPSAWDSPAGTDGGRTHRSNGLRSLPYITPRVRASPSSNSPSKRAAAHRT